MYANRQLLSQDKAMSSEMADLHIRSTSLAAENEALRGHVQHLQDRIARLEDTITVSSSGCCLHSAHLYIVKSFSTRVHATGTGAGCC